MASSLSRTISSKLRKPFPLSSLSLNHSLCQILNPTSFSSSPSSHHQNSQDPSSNPSYILYAGIPTPSVGSGPIDPSFKSLSCLDPVLNIFKSHSGFPQTVRNGKPRCHFPSLMSSYSEYTVSLRPHMFYRAKPTIPSLPFVKSFASSANSSSEAKASDPEPKPITPSSPISYSSDSEPKSHSQHPEFQHQEIVGPTVERDVSPLAEETRQVLQNLKKTIYNLSRIVALLGLVQLSCGAWIAYTSEASPLNPVSIQSFMAFSFPFSLAFLLRQMLKPMSFFQKMEEQGRLQILTLSLQVSKCLNLFFLRLRVVSFFCVIGMSVGLLYSTWTWSGLN